MFIQKHLEKLRGLLNNSVSLKYGIAAILLAVPLYPKFPFISVPGTYVSVRLEDFLVGTVSLIALFCSLPSIKKIISGKIEQAILLFLFVAAVSIISGVFLTKTIPASLGLLHWIRRIEYFAPFFVSLVFLKKEDKTSLEFFLKILMLIIVLVLIYGYGQKHLGWPVIITQNEEYSKGIALRWIPGTQIGSTFAGHYDLATFLVFTLPIIIALFFLMKDRLSQIFLATTFFAGLWLMANAAQRISVISYLVSSVVVLFILKKYKAIPIIVAVSIIFFGLSSDLLTRYVQLFNVVIRSFPKRVVYQLSSPVNAYEGVLPARRSNLGMTTPTPAPVFEDRSTSIRLNVEWPRAIRAFKKNPLLGTGFSSITLATDNDFLRLLGEVGILGFLSFTLILVRMSLLYLKSFPLTDRFRGVELAFMAGTFAGFTGVIINSLFIDVFEASKVAIIFWLFMGISVTIARRTLYEQNN